MSKPPKIAWADMTDDDLDIDVVISKRGIKVKSKPVVPPSPEPDKKTQPPDSN